MLIRTTNARMAKMIKYVMGITNVYKDAKQLKLTCTICGRVTVTTTLENW